jgi:hypothetical protein
MWYAPDFSNRVAESDSGLLVDTWSKGQQVLFYFSSLNFPFASPPAPNMVLAAGVADGINLNYIY